MAMTYARERDPLPANRALAAKGGSWAKALARAQKSPANDRSSRTSRSDGDLPAYSLFSPAGFAPRR